MSSADLQLEPGAALGPWVVEQVDPKEMKTLAILLADPNPIHLDSDAARRAGLGDRVVTQGPASVGFVLNMLADAAPGATIRDVRVRFTANVHGGDCVVAAGSVERLEEVHGGRAVRCAVWLDVRNGPRALDGTATLFLPADRQGHPAHSKEN
jgi:3-hydroxybutyryl-CoA dehydratase